MHYSMVTVYKISQYLVVLLSLYRGQNHAWEFQNKFWTEAEWRKNWRDVLPRAEKMKERCTNIHILDILIIVMDIGKCYSAIKWLQKCIISKSLYLFSLFGRNVVYSLLVMLLFTITLRPIKENENKYFTIIINFCNSNGTK